MDMIKTVIVDDEPLARQIVREYLETHPKIEIVADCQDAFQALEAIERHHPELLFLDIQMPEMNGFELLNMLDEIPHVIFSTAYDQYALKAFEINAVDYLLKPYVQSRFDTAVQRALKSIQQDQSDKGKIEDLLRHLSVDHQFMGRILVKQSGKIIVLNVDEIRWIEAVEDYVNLHAEKGTYLALQTMGRMEIRLNPQHFIRVHRSYIVNMKAIREMEPWSNGRLQCLMSDGRKIVTSRSGAKKLKKWMI